MRKRPYVRALLWAAVPSLLGTLGFQFMFFMAPRLETQPYLWYAGWYASYLLGPSRAFQRDLNRFLFSAGISNWLLKALAQWLLSWIVYAAFFAGLVFAWRSFDRNAAITSGIQLPYRRCASKAAVIAVSGWAAFLLLRHFLPYTYPPQTPVQQFVLIACYVLLFPGAEILVLLDYLASALLREPVGEIVIKIETWWLIAPLIVNWAAYFALFALMARRKQAKRP